jgi:hypothetical protein
MTLAEIDRKIKRARHKAARISLGLETAERRIKHFKKRRNKYRKENHPKAAERATKNLHAWQRRQSWLQDRHVFLQTLLDRRLHKKAVWLQKHKDPFPPAPGGGDWVTFDNHEVAHWIAKILKAARDSGYWNGYVISGRRSPQYSEELCIHMCGRPYCPGLCAGTSSNHAGPPSFKGVFPEGAVDVSDYAGLRRYCEAHAPELVGGCRVLPSDCPHFSHAGN